MYARAFRTSLTAAAVMVAGISAADALAMRAGFDASSLAANDDGSTGLVAIGFDVNFFGVTTNQLYVNNNGNITFDSPLSSYTPFDLTSTGQQIIAPFFADVDTNNGGSVTYGAGTVDGHDAFGVSWNDVAFYGGSGSTNVNSFQVILIDRSDTGAGNFDIEFNYDQILWEAGTASDSDANGLGGDSARVGYSNGSGDAGTFFELAGSAVNGAFLDGGPDALVSNSLGSAVAGRYVFSARAGEIEASPGEVPLPGALPLLLGGLGAFAAIRRRR